MKKIRSHMASHGSAWLDLFITALALVVMLHVGMTKGAELFMFKWALVAASQIAAHSLILFLYGLRFDYRTADKVDRICIVALRLGLAYCFSVGG